MDTEVNQLDGIDDYYNIFADTTYRALDQYAEGHRQAHQDGAGNAEGGHYGNLKEGICDYHFFHTHAQQETAADKQDIQIDCMAPSQITELLIHATQ